MMLPVRLKKNIYKKKKKKKLYKYGKKVRGKMKCHTSNLHLNRCLKKYGKMYCLFETLCFNFCPICEKKYLKHCVLTFVRFVKRSI